MACAHAGGWHPHGGRCHVVYGAVGHWVVGQAIGQPIRHVAMVRRWRRFLIEDSELILLGLEIVVAVGADFAIGAGFMRAAVSSEEISYPSE